ncbi:hypothetical protein [Comamonas avium]|uniref:Transposase DDE domain-containing protein n=1 Tax=Comamonas avium TaxID=2762231 RepID=A0ABR8SAT5_9BURK|nr:hypothetical protein [Comamonas avium]MBD7960568.1 hypothetical protein [Comamonas avium]
MTVPALQRVADELRAKLFMTLKAIVGETRFLLAVLRNVRRKVLSGFSAAKTLLSVALH